jgi:hypothetical protein
MPETSMPATTLQLVGAVGFGMLIGWYLYYINRYRTSQVDLGDLVTVIAAIGGGAILTLFPARTDLFGAYGIGLAIGFFGYFVVLTILVGMTRNFTVEFFLDGRRKKPADDEIMPGYNPAEPNKLPQNTVMGETTTSGSQGGPLS